MIIYRLFTYERRVISHSVAAVMPWSTPRISLWKWPVLVSVYRIFSDTPLLSERAIVPSRSIDTSWYMLILVDIDTSLIKIII